ncbi:MAG: polysaccharide deacetylase family protein [Hyphomicrobiaceae bacterium]|nr:polysaccharide deacetylase family protein [Hyphomicrobiaceae bacterium]
MRDGHLADIEALTKAAHAFSERHQMIPHIDWPDGARIAVNFTIDYDAMLRRRMANEPPMQLAKGEFGGRVGIWRLIDLFDRNKVKATFFTPGRICELYPQSLVKITKSGHEIADHMWEHRVPTEPDIEEAHLTRATAALTRIYGRRPVGTRSSHTAGLLRREGYIYRSHGHASASHLPYYLVDQTGKNVLVELPWHYSIDDAMYYNFGWLESVNLAQKLSDPDRVLEMWWAGFRHQYLRGGYYNVVLHPFISGRALRIDMLDRLITRMKTLPGVWFPSCEDVARHCLAHYPPQKDTLA